MAITVEDRSERSRRSNRDRASIDGASRAADRLDPSPWASREAVLRRIAAELSGRRDLAGIFDDVLDHSMELFGADRAGLWLTDGGPIGFRLAARRGLSDAFLEVVSRVAQDPAAPSARAAAARRPLVISDPFRGAVTPELRRLYRAEGIRTACFVPVVFLDEPLGLLILYHLAPHPWPDEELELVGSFADQMATAIQNARLYGSVRGFAARLEAIKDLAGRLARISDVGAIGSAIVAEVRSLYESDTARVYTVDRQTGMCEPIAFGGMFLGVEDPPADLLRVPIGKGLTGWVAAHATPVRVADSRYDPRRLVVGPDEEPESMLLAPMTYEDTVRGVLVVSKKGIDRYSADDLTTLSIFAGFAAQALVNAENLGRLHKQQAELERRLASQRSLLDVNETLLSARDPHAVLDVIADSLKSVVRYDNLTIYRLDRERGVRVAVLARDRYAEVILAEQIPVGVGLTGWAVDRGAAVLANDAHLDPRAAQIPGTPAEPESLIVVPLRILGDVIGTLNIGRMGETEAHFSTDEFELTQLFAGQAAIALQNAEALQAAETRARLDALTGLRNHGAFQADFDELLARESGEKAPESFAVLMLDLDGFKAFNDGRGHPAGDRLLRSIANALAAGVRPDDRAYRYGGDEFAAILPGVGSDEARRVARRVADAIDEVGTHADGPPVTVSIGAAAFPADGRTKDELVIRADTELYLEKAARRSARGLAGPGSPGHAAGVAAA